MVSAHVTETKRLIVAALAAAGRYPGALVLDSDGLEWSHGALDPAARIHAASISKTVTAAIALQLVDEGKIDLSDTVGKHLDAGACSGLTIEDLLSHRSGIVRDPGNAWNDDQWPDRGALPAFIRASEPTGRAPKYSNFGFALLGLVIEAATGTAYVVEARRRVFDPLGLETAGFDDPRALPGYGRDRGSGRSILDVHASGALAPATGLTASPRDLVKLIGEYERVVPEALRRMQREDRWPEEERDGYGLGLVLWGVGEDRWFGHSGGWSGTQSVLMRHEDTGRTILVVFDAIDAMGSSLPSRSRAAQATDGSNARPRSTRTVGARRSTAPTASANCSSTLSGPRSNSRNLSRTAGSARTSSTTSAASPSRSMAIRSSWAAAASNPTRDSK